MREPSNRRHQHCQSHGMMQCLGLCTKLDHRKGIPQRHSQGKLHCHRQGMSQPHSQDMPHCHSRGMKQCHSQDMNKYHSLVMRHSRSHTLKPDHNQHMTQHQSPDKNIWDLLNYSTAKAFKQAQIDLRYKLRFRRSRKLKVNRQSSKLPSRSKQSQMKQQNLNHLLLYIPKL